MKKTVILCMFAAALATPAIARNTEYKLSLADLLASPEAKAKLDGSVKFLFGDKTMPAGAERKGGEVINRVAKGPGRVDNDFAACNAAAIDALASLQAKAKQLNADAVVDIVSFYQAKAFSSTTEFECHAGLTGGHVSFKASYVALPKN